MISSVIVSYEHSGKDVACLSVVLNTGSKRPMDRFVVLSVFYGDEATKLFEKLTGEVNP